MRHRHTDRAAQHVVSIDQNGAATGATLQDAYASRVAPLDIDNLRHTVPQTEANDHGRRRGNVPALEVRAAWLNLIEQCFVTRERFARVLGW